MIEIGALLVGELLLMGAVVGFLAGLLGVGGGMMQVPFMAALLTNRGVDNGTAFKMAIATSGATILFTSVSSLVSHHRHGAVRWPLVAGLAPGVLAGGVLAGAGVLALLRGQWLALAFAAFLVVMAWRLGFGTKPKVDRALPGMPGLLAMGGLIGFISALVGAGGAFLSVPFMSRRGVSMHDAVGTAAALGFPIAVASTVGYLVAGRSLAPALPGALGLLYLPGVLIVAATSVLLAPLGAHTAHRLPTARLKQAFAILLAILAVQVAWKALAD